MRLLVTLLFLGALTVFLWAGLQYLTARFARPLDRHRREHERIEGRLSELERRSAAGGERETVPEACSPRPPS